MMYGNKISTCQLSRMTFTCFNKKTLVEIIICVYKYNPCEIIISIFSGHFVKSNTKFKMCVHMIVVYSHTGSKRRGEPATWCGLY